MNDERAAVAKLCISGEAETLLEHSRLVKSCTARLKSILFASAFASLFLFLSFSLEGREDFPALRIKMRNDKPSAAGHALPRSSAKLQVSICERKTGGYGETVASTSYTSGGYRLFLMQRSRGVFRQSFAYNRLATDLWIFIYYEKRCSNFPLRYFESRTLETRYRHICSIHSLSYSWRTLSYFSQASRTCSQLFAKAIKTARVHVFLLKWILKKFYQKGS